MLIDEFDTPETIALKRQISILKAENAMLRDKRGVWPHNMPLTVGFDELPLIPCDIHAITLKLVASWNCKLEPWRGGVHAIGIARTNEGADEVLRVSYFASELAGVLPKAAASAILAELHKRVLREIASALDLS